jgi:predicted pyridoxine 5'-phosphate oxidase superfamily flavin-nucleotide-binding protein
MVNDPVSLFLMDYAHRERLKILGRVAITDAKDDPDLTAKLVVEGYDARVERAVVIMIAAFDWNCPQHITPRFTEAELEVVLGPVRDEMALLRLENERLRREIAERHARAQGSAPGIVS